MRVSIRTAGLSATAALLALTGLSVAAPQASAVSCSGSSCNGKNPQTTGCSSDGDTVSDFQTWPGGHEIELRYSKKCKAVWVRGDHFSTVKLEAGHYDSCGSWIVQKSVKTPSSGYWHTESTPNYQWTPMISVSGYDRFRYFGDGDSAIWKNSHKSSAAIAPKQLFC